MSPHKKSSFWNRALRNARIAWDKIATDNDSVASISSTPDLNDDDRVKIIRHMQACLDRRGGEVSARKRAAALGYVYLSLNATGRKRFLTILMGFLTRLMVAMRFIPIVQELEILQMVTNHFIAIRRPLETQQVDITHFILIQQEIIIL